MSDPYKEFDRNARRTAPRAFLWTAVAVAAVIVLVGGVMLIRYVTAEPRGALDQRDKTIANGNYRIASYDAFFDKCNEIVAKESVIENFRDQLKAATTAKEKKDALINLNAIINTRVELVQSYNADAQKADTRGHFRASNLPYHIDPTYHQETPTTCAA